MSDDDCDGSPRGRLSGGFVAIQLSPSKLEGSISWYWSISSRVRQLFFESPCTLTIPFPEITTVLSVPSLTAMPFPIPTEKIEHRHFINGEFVESSDKRTFTLTSPYNHEKITDVCEATVEDTNRAVAAAKAAFPAWAALDPPSRGSYLKKLAGLIRESGTELAQLDAMSMGRPVSTYFDAYMAANHFDHYSEAGFEAKGETSLNTPGFVNMTFRQPIGPVVGSSHGGTWS